MSDNYDAALKAEMQRVERGFHGYSSSQRATMRASRRLGHRQRESLGETFYTHPDVPGICFPSRKAAAEAALKGHPQ